jgi:mono/diheme cytochrome c family protein
MHSGMWSGVVVALAWPLPPAPPPSTPSTLVELREEARQLAARRCGSCHSSQSASSKPRALEVFDTERVEWTWRMSDAQLRAALQRFGAPSIPSGERERFTAYIDAELADRRTRPH